MKRLASTLVDYSSSEDENDSLTPPPTIAAPVAKKRKLPALSETISGPKHVDNPALHQGRIRTTPHVEGQFAAHVYVALNLKRCSKLRGVVADTLRDAKELVPSIQNIVSPDEDAELHVSLSRPIFLRAHQREDLKKVVRNAAREHEPFTLSFAAFAELINDEQTRTFLTLEIGAGHHELRKVSDSLTPLLQTFRQKEYYDKPRFHASIGWALLDRPPHVKMDPALADFPTIPHLPEELISQLESKYAGTLSTKACAYSVDRITVRIGKDVTSWKLGRASDTPLVS